MGTRGRKDILTFLHLTMLIIEEIKGGPVSEVLNHLFFTLFIHLIGFLLPVSRRMCNPKHIKLKQITNKHQILLSGSASLTVLKLFGKNNQGLVIIERMNFEHEEKKACKCDTQTHTYRNTHTPADHRHYMHVCSMTK